MKIFIDAVNDNNRTYLGVILVGDLGQVYLADCKEVLCNDKKMASLEGVRRVFYYKKNVQPLYLNNPPIIINKYLRKMDIVEDEALIRFPQIEKSEIVEPDILVGRDKEFQTQLKYLIQNKIKNDFILRLNQNIKTI